MHQAQFTFALFTSIVSTRRDFRPTFITVGRNVIARLRHSSRRYSVCRSSFQLRSLRSVDALLPLSATKIDWSIYTCTSGIYLMRLVSSHVCFILIVSFVRWRRQGRTRVGHGPPHKSPARLLTRPSFIVICKLQCIR